MSNIPLISIRWPLSVVEVLMPLTYLSPSWQLRLNVHGVLIMAWTELLIDLCLFHIKTWIKTFLIILTHWKFVCNFKVNEVRQITIFVVTLVWLPWDRLDILYCFGILLFPFDCNSVTLGSYRHPPVSWTP